MRLLPPAFHGDPIEYILREPPFALQPLDPVAVLRAALDKSRDSGDDDCAAHRLVLLGRCIDWVQRRDTCDDAQERREALEEWLCEECALQSCGCSSSSFIPEAVKKNSSSSSSALSPTAIGSSP